MRTDPNFHSMLKEGMRAAKTNDDIELPYFVLRPDVPRQFLEFLIHQMNTMPKNKSTGSGVWQFLWQFKSVG